MTAFARVTEAHDAVLLGHTPCAGLLYRWLLRRKPAGKVQELELEEFVTWSRVCRPNPYSIRHAKRALAELIESGVVEVMRRYTSQILKVICYHPADPETEPKAPSSHSDKNVQVQDGNVQDETEMSKTGASNPHHFVPTYREYRETTNIVPTHHPVQEIGREGSLDEIEPLRVDTCETDNRLNTSKEEKI